MELKFVVVSCCAMIIVLIGLKELSVRGCRRLGDGVVDIILRLMSVASIRVTSYHSYAYAL